VDPRARGFTQAHRRDTTYKTPPAVGRLSAGTAQGAALGLPARNEHLSAFLVKRLEAIAAYRVHPARIHVIELLNTGIKRSFAACRNASEA
jgi:hypothetical protein